MNSARGKLQEQIKQILCKKVATLIGTSKSKGSKNVDSILSMFSTTSKKLIPSRTDYRSFLCFISALKMQTALRLSYNKT